MRPVKTLDRFVEIIINEYTSLLNFQLSHQEMQMTGIEIHAGVFG